MVHVMTTPQVNGALSSYNKAYTWDLGEGSVSDVQTRESEFYPYHPRCPGMPVASVPWGLRQEVNRGLLAARLVPSSGGGIGIRQRLINPNT